MTYGFPLTFPRKPLFGAALLSASLLFAGCGAPTPDSAAPADTTTDAASPDEAGLKMAVLLYGPPNDNSWNQAAFEGAKAIESTGVEVSISESVAEADVARVLRQYAETGYTLIVAHSFSYQDAVFQVAEEFPDVYFAWAGGIDNTGENVADYDQPFFEGAYLVGMVAADLSESGRLGALYGFDIPVCSSMGNAMEAGAQQIRPDATLVATAVGDWADIAKAKEAALAQADTGVDYWLECGEGPALGAMEAAKDQGGYVTGYVGDMSVLAPDVVASSIVWNMEPLFQAMLSDIEGGSFANQYYQQGIAEGGVTIAINPAIESLLDSSTLEMIADVEAQIRSGDFEVPFIIE